MEHKLTRQDTNLLKGLAIVGIILHNFCHMLPRIVAENEYTYHTFKNAQLLGSLEHGYHVGLSLLSYFGHYGVPVFLSSSRPAAISRNAAAITGILMTLAATSGRSAWNSTGAPPERGRV